MEKTKFGKTLLCQIMTVPHNFRSFSLLKAAWASLPFQTNVHYSSHWFFLNNLFVSDGLEGSIIICHMLVFCVISSLLLLFSISSTLGRKLVGLQLIICEVILSCFFTLRLAQEVEVVVNPRVVCLISSSSRLHVSVFQLCVCLSVWIRGMDKIRCHLRTFQVMI